MPYKDRVKQLEYQKAHYINNKSKYQAYRNTAKQRNKKYIRDFKNRPCQHCDVQYEHYLMEYAHIKGTDKVCKVGNMYLTHSINRIKEEIGKCLILCVICHRRYDYENV